jgi:Carboxypeptidase regulatory-like domain
LSSNDLRAGLQQKWQRKKLAVACLVIALCFFIGNDTYKAQTVIRDNKDLFSNKSVINYLEAKNRWSLSNFVARNRIYGKAGFLPNFSTKPRKTIKTFRDSLVGSDTCNTPVTNIPSLPYNDTGTTVGATDNYNLPADTTNPTLTGCPTCTATGRGPAGSLPRGAVYTGTGTGPDTAYRITYSTAGSMVVTMDPTGAQDLTVIVYTSICSSNLADGIVISDTGGGGAIETVTISSLPVGTYHIVVDGYSTGGTAPGPSGPYTLAVTGTGTVVVPTAASVSVSGQVLSADGKGLSRVSVSITDSNGNIRTAVSNTFGYYKFDDVRAGDTYILQVSSKKYQFSNPTQIVSVNDNIADLNFNSIE